MKPKNVSARHSIFPNVLPLDSWILRELDSITARILDSRGWILTDNGENFGFSELDSRR